MDWGSSRKPVYVGQDRKQVQEVMTAAAKMAAVRTSITTQEAAQVRWSKNGVAVRMARSGTLVEVGNGVGDKAEQVIVHGGVFDLVRKMVALYPSDTIELAVIHQLQDKKRQPAYLSVRDPGLPGQDFRLNLWKQDIAEGQFDGMPPAVGPWLDTKAFAEALRLACLPRPHGHEMMDHRVRLIPFHGGVKVVGAYAGAVVCRVLSEHGPALPQMVVLTGDTVETVRKAIGTKGQVRLGMTSETDQFDREKVRLAIDTGTNRLAVKAGRVEETEYRGGIARSHMEIIDKFTAVVESAEPVCRVSRKEFVPVVRRLALGATAAQEGVVQFRVTDGELVMTRWATNLEYEQDSPPQTVESLPVDAVDTAMPAVSAKRLHQLTNAMRTPELELRSGNGDYQWMAVSEPDKGWWTGLLEIVKLEPSA